ncbi:MULTISPECIES: barstar family protein [Pseudomonas]|uniref:Barstar family protein n=1 Tax=Pseudomonas soli TaxID=1306993 RepID=A0AAJ5MH86_9PSED|nr:MULTISPECIES: barstar family protein [Pseudomonas]MDX2310566.1 barstar family protein [Pseudomonas sp. On1]PYC44450.1 ribonuclease inhibitor [Pseudomonas soli]UXZ43625.1 barstar family protein [Pseudomonas soli]
MTNLRAATVDLNGIAFTAELHAALSEALGFPYWYGCNWDAFWDAVTGLVEMPGQLRLLGWRSLVECLPVDAALLKECLDDLATEYPELAPMVIFD